MNNETAIKMNKETAIKINKGTAIEINKKMAKQTNQAVERAHRRVAFAATAVHFSRERHTEMRKILRPSKDWMNLPGLCEGQAYDL